VSPILDSDEALANEQLRAGDDRADDAHAARLAAETQRVDFGIDAGPLSGRAHEEILRERINREAEIAALRGDGVIER